MSKIIKRLSSLVLASAMLGSAMVTGNLVSAETTAQLDNLVQEYLWDFEDASDLDGFVKDASNLSTYKLGVNPEDANDGVFEIERKFYDESERDEKGNYPQHDSKISTIMTFDEAQAAKVVSVDIYDHGPGTDEQVVLQLVGEKSSDYPANEIYVGTKMDGDVTKYWYRVKPTPGSDLITGYFDVERTEGWHTFTVDCSEEGELTLMIDGNEEKAINVATTANTYAYFKELKLIDFWMNRAAVPNVEQNVYIDNVSISYVEQEPTSQITPSKPIVYDLENMIGFTPIEGKESYTNYEYSLDGIAFVDCTANPQPIPNEDYAVGDVQIRLKTTAMDQPNNPPLKSTEAFTKSDDLILDFEETSDLEGFTVYDGKAPAITTDFMHSGFSSMNLGGYGTYYDFGYQEEKYVTMWIYDSMAKNGTRDDKTYISLVDSEGSTSKPWQNSAAYMISFDASRQYYWARLDGQYYFPNNVKRTVGWHAYTWDFTSGDTVKVYVDGILLAEAPANGFDYFNTADWSWNTKVDDISVSSTKEMISLPTAPTNGVVDDDNKLFGFDYVPGYTDASYYEFSTDKGQTWSSCTANPQPVGDGPYAVGEVMVRIKAMDGEKAGAYLLSDAEFTSKSNILYRTLQNEIEFTKGFFDGDLVKNEDYDNFYAILDEVSMIEETETDEVKLQNALDDLATAMANLDIDLENHTIYEFEKGEAELNPFYALTGELEVGEVLTAFGKDDFTTYDMKAGAELFYENTDGTYNAEAIYTFPQELEDKIVSMAWYPAVTTGGTELVLSNNSGDYIALLAPAGNQTNYRVRTSIDGKVTEEELEIRRLSGPHNIYWDMANSDTGVKLYLDERLVGELEGMTSFNKLAIEVIGATDADETTTFDRVQIIEKNPIQSMQIVDESAVIGYYETYAMPKVLLEIDALYDDYTTTDVLTYTSANSNIINVTSDGTCEGMSFGTTDVTVSTASGLSDTISIEVKDFKLEDVYITESPMIDVVAIDAPGQDSNNSVPVEKLEEITIDINESKVLNTVLTPANATARLVDWTSSDENVVFVQDGLITGVNYGEAIVTITSQDGTNKTDTVKVIVAPDSFEAGMEIFVAMDGDDIMGDGSMENPYASIDRARDEARVLNGLLPDKGVIIYFREGSYSFLESFELNDQDSGTAQNPITYASYEDETVTFLGGVEFDVADMSKVNSDDNMYDRIPESARDDVYVIDLAQFGLDKRELQAIGMSSYTGAFDAWNTTEPYYSVWLNGEAMTLSRYPDTGFIKTTTIHYNGENSRYWEADMIANGQGHPYEPGMENDTFVFSSSSLSASKLATWSESIDGGKYGPWMSGYWGVVYAAQSVPLESIEGNQIRSGMVSPYIPTANANFYVYNLIEELSIENEWYIDQFDENSLNLYIFPPSGTDMTDSSNIIRIPTLDEVMFDMYETDYININGIDFWGGNQGLFSIEGGTHNVVRKAEMSGTVGTLGAVRDSKDEIAKFNGFEMCDIKNIDGGISLGSGDVYTLERGYNYVENSSFYNFSMVKTAYNPAVSLGGVGNRVSNTTFDNAPQNVVMPGGPEATVEFCEFSDFSKTSGDQAAIYTGRDTINRGTIIRNCYFHSIGEGHSVANSGIYLDDAKAGVLILDNVFEGVGQGITTGGGRDVSIIGNKFVNLANGITNAPFLYIFPIHIHNAGLNVYYESGNYSQVNTRPWDEPDSAYGRFDHMYYMLEDNFGFGKYNTYIDNEFINMYRSADANETITDYNVWTKYWKVMPYEDQRALLDDWIFDKGNDKSNNLGNDDDSYKTKYSVNLSVQSGEGEVIGTDDDLIKDYIKKVVAEPDTGYEFVHWVDASGKVVSDNSVYFFTLDSNVTLEAVFQIAQ